METMTKSKKLQDVKVLDVPTLKTGNAKFDTWFSRKGGMVLRSAIYLSGTSGAGKTTLMINLMNWLSEVPTCLYEREVESQDICEQTSNVIENIKHTNAHICDEQSHPHFSDFLAELDVLKPKVVIVDSVQAIAMYDFSDISEEDACNYIVKTLRKWVADNEAVLFLIGHNTKEGEFAGRNTIIQMMDAHIDMVYDKKLNTRTMSWGKKNRKGPMGSLYYTFEDAGIVLYTPEEWDALNNTMDFKENFAKFIHTYVTARKTKNNQKFIDIYNEKVKKIKKIEDPQELCNELYKTMMDLSNEFGI